MAAAHGSNPSGGKMGVLLQRLGARPPSNKGSLPPRIPIGVGKGVPAPGLRAPPPLKGAGKGPGRGAGDVSPFQHKDIGKGKKGLQDARQGVFAKGKDGGKDAPFRHEKGGGVRGLLYSGYSKGATNGAVSRERDFANGTEKPSEEEPDSTIEGGDAKPPEAAVEAANGTPEAGEEADWKRRRLEMTSLPEEPGDSGKLEEEDLENFSFEAMVAANDVRFD